MSQPSTYRGIRPLTLLNDDNTNALARGVRVTLQADGHVNVQDATIRGDYVTLQTIDAAKSGEGVGLGAGGKVPMLSLVQTNVADLAYTAANGKVTNVSTNAVLIGRFVTAAPAANTLADVELFEVQ